MIAGSIEIQLMASVARLQRDMDQARQVVSGTTSSMARAAEMARSALAGIAGGIGLSKIAEISDSYAKLTAQLRAATSSTKSYADAYADVKRIATSAQSDLSATGSLYASLTRATKDLGTSQKTVADITEAVNLAFKISGAGAQESEGAILQLSQAFAAGALRGDEFNSVAEAAPRLMQAIGDGIGVPVAALRNMAAEGKLTAEVVANALPKALGQLRSEAGQVQTIAGSFVVLKNNLMEFVGTEAQASGVVSVITTGINAFANNLGLVVGAIGLVKGAQFINWLSDAAERATGAASVNRALAASHLAVAESNALGTAQASLSAGARLAEVRAATLAAEGNVQLALTANALIPAQARAAVAAEAHAVALAELTVAQRAATAGAAALALGTAALEKVLALTGGPLGLLITVLGAAAMAWSYYGDKAAEANDKAKRSTEESTQEVIDRLNNKSNLLANRIALAQVPGMQEIAKFGPEADKVANLRNEIIALQDSINAGTADKNASGYLIQLQFQYTDLVHALENAMVQQKAFDSQSSAAIELRQKMTGVNQAYLDELAKLKKGLDDGIISQADYSTAVKKLATDTFNGSEAGKDFAKSLDLSTSAIARRAEVQGLLNQRDQEHIQFLKNTSQIDEEEAIKRTTKAQIDALNIEKAATAGQLAAAYKKADNQKEQADLAGKLGNISIKIASAQAKGQEDLFAIEQQRYRAAVGASADLIEKEMDELTSLRQQTQAQEDYNAQIGLTPKQIAAITAARLQDAAARKDIEANIAEGLDLTGEKAARIRAQAAELRKQADGAVAGAVKQEMFDKNLQDANALVQIMSALDEAAQSAAQGMADSFGRVGEAIGGLTTSMTGYGKTQAAIAAQLAASLKDAGADPLKIQRANTLAAEASAQAQVKSYGDMASAAKGFFKENSAGYKVMSGIEKAYRAAEMALALETMAKKILFKETEVAANTTLNATKLTGEATASAASTGLAATEASAWGVTAVVKAIASLPFPLNLAAGAATLAAVVAIGAKMVGGLSGGSVSLSEQRQAAQGTGTVLGSSSAKSESISRAIELSASNSSTQIDYLSGMLTSLRAIETGISSFASQVVQGGLTDGSNVSIKNSGTYNALNSKAAGGLGSLAGAGVGYAAGAGLTAFTSLAALGGPIGLAIGAVAGKFLGSALNSVLGGKKSLEDSGFTMDKASLGAILANGARANSYADIKTDGGWFSSDKHNTQLQSLGQDANVQFSLVIESLADSIGEAGKLLGVSGAGFEAQLNSFVVDIGKVSLKGKTGDEIQKELEAVFSKLGDQMAAYAVGGLQQFQKVGEGYLETLVRVASDYAKVEASLQSIGMTFGSMGVQSIAAREGLISLMGGIDEFQSKTAGFASNFLTKAEQLAPVSKYVDDQLAALGLGYIKTRDQFKDVVLSLNLTTAAGQSQYAALMSLQEAFAATHAATVDLTKTEQEVADERKDWQDQLDQLTMTQTQLLAKQRNALAEVNRPLFDLVQTAQKLADTATNMEKFRDAAKSLNDSLLTGSLSVLTPEAQYAELHDQYEKTKAAAMAGDTKAQDSVFSALNAWLTASQKLNAGDTQYQADFAEAQRDSAAMAAWASGQVDTAQAQLNAMNTQTDALQSANTALNAANTILQTIAQNTSLTGGAGAAPNAANVIGTALSALGTAIKAVQSEVAGLRKDQNVQTGNQIGANAEGQQAIVNVLNKVATTTTVKTVEKVALE